MKICAVGLFGISLALASVATASAQQPDPQQMYEEQRACEADVYALCGNAIPDTERIATCLRSRWKDVSQACRTVMTNYSRRHKRRKSD